MKNYLLEAIGWTLFCLSITIFFAGLGMYSTAQWINQEDLFGLEFGILCAICTLGSLVLTIMVISDIIITLRSKN